MIYMYRHTINGQHRITLSKPDNLIHYIPYSLYITAEFSRLDIYSIRQVSSGLSINECCDYLLTYHLPICPFAYLPIYLFTQLTL